MCNLLNDLEQICQLIWNLSDDLPGRPARHTRTPGLPELRRRAPESSQVGVSTLGSTLPGRTCCSRGQPNAHSGTWGCGPTACTPGRARSALEPLRRARPPPPQGGHALRTCSHVPVPVPACSQGWELEAGGTGVPRSRWHPCMGHHPLRQDALLTCSLS